MAKSFRDRLLARSEALRPSEQDAPSAEQVPSAEQHDSQAEDAAYRAGQAELTEAMQAARSEQEAYDLLRRHLERTIPESSAVVLVRDDDKGTLEAATAVPPRTVLADKLREAEPETCLAVRLARPYERVEGRPEPLLSCGLCGAVSAGSTCTPSLAGGAVVGSVLVLRRLPLNDRERERISDSVQRATPVLASLRRLSLAQRGASTDALSGLPNAGAVRESMKRMIAQASRRFAPLSTVIVDLDHFRQVNELYGHGKGDEVLAAAAQVLSRAVRDSDLVGHCGDEEFVALLPDTDLEGALRVAEKMRRAVSEMNVPGVERRLSASFGIAIFPADGIDSESLLEAASGALAAAKSNGRNRVEVVP